MTEFGEKLIGFLRSVLLRYFFKACFQFSHTAVRWYDSQPAQDVGEKNGPKITMLIWVVLSSTIIHNIWSTWRDFIYDIWRTSDTCSGAFKLLLALKRGFVFCFPGNQTVEPKERFLEKDQDQLWRKWNDMNRGCYLGVNRKWSLGGTCFQCLADPCRETTPPREQKSTKTQQTQDILGTNFKRGKMLQFALLFYLILLEPPL